MTPDDGPSGVTPAGGRKRATFAVSIAICAMMPRLASADPRPADAATSTAAATATSAAALEPEEAPRAATATATAVAEAEVFSVGSFEEARGYENDPDGVTGADVALFVPRLVLTPLRWILTGVYWPIQATLRFVEKKEVVENVVDVLYNDERNAAIIPSINLFSRNGLTLGATAFHDDVFGHDERIALSANFLGRYIQSYDLSFSAEHLLGTFVWLEVQGRYDGEPNIRFYGLGNPPEVGGTPLNLDPYAGSQEARYRQERILARIRLGTIFDVGVGELKLGGSAIYNRRRFDGSQEPTATERSITAVYDTSKLVGFADGTDLIEATFDVVLDLRTQERAPAGVFLEAFVGGVPPQGQYHYFHWGAEAVGYVPLFAETRVLALRLSFEAVEGDSENIPFSDLPRLGGPYRLRGHDYEQFRDEKSMLASLEYHYPIHRHLRGALFFDIGRVGGDYGDLFKSSPGNPFRYGFGGGLVVAGTDSDVVRIDVSYGDGLFVFLTTDPFASSYRRRANRL